MFFSLDCVREIPACFFCLACEHETLAGCFLGLALKREISAGCFFRLAPIGESPCSGPLPGQGRSGRGRGASRSGVGGLLYIASQPLTTNMCISKEHNQTVTRTHKRKRAITTKRNTHTQTEMGSGGKPRSRRMYRHVDVCTCTYILTYIHT